MKVCEYSLECVICGDKASFIWNGYSLCYKHFDPKNLKKMLKTAHG